jgi:threonine synthase
MGLEIAEQLGWELPEWIVYPTGGGTGIIGMHKAFDELERLGLIGPRRPRFVVVQMAGCAPLVRAFARGEETAAPWEEPRTRVWGLRVPHGRAIAVAEERLPEIESRAARQGLLVGPEGAAALAAVEDLAAEGALAEGERVVVFQTGHPGNYR